MTEIPKGWTPVPVELPYDVKQAVAAAGQKAYREQVYWEAIADRMHAALLAAAPEPPATELEAARARIAVLEAALREARSMLRSCGFEEPVDPDYEASWNKGLATIDAALSGDTTP